MIATTLVALHTYFDTYRFRVGDRRLTISIPAIFHPHYAQVLMGRHGRPVKLSSPRGSFFWVRAGDEVDRPRAGLLRGGPHPLVWLLAHDDEEGLDRKDILVWEYDGKTWHRVLPAKTEPEYAPSFSIRGGFLPAKNGLLVWDFEYDLRYATYDRQPYSLKTYAISGNRIYLTSKRTTRQRYSPEGPDGIPEHVPKRRDPLREFGLRWRWWGPIGRRGQ